MIKAVIFDFFGVICSEEYWQSVKTKFTDEEFHQLAKGVHTGQLSWQQFVQKVAAEIGETPDKVQQMYETQRINLELAACIDKLHEKYKTALLTNSHAAFIKPLLKKTGLDKVFDEVVISSDIGIVKPDPRIYEYVTNKLDVEAAQAVFVDDDQVRAEGAKKIGLQAIVYENFGQMRRDLEQVLGN